VRVRDRVPFRLQHVRESISVILKPRSQHYRLYILFFFCTIFIQQACKSGEVDITVLYTLKSPLNWSRSMYGYLLATDYACTPGRPNSVLSLSTRISAGHRLRVYTWSSQPRPCLIHAVDICSPPTTRVSVWRLQFFFPVLFTSFTSTTSVLRSSALCSRSFVWR